MHIFIWIVILNTKTCIMSSHGLPGSSSSSDLPIAALSSLPSFSEETSPGLANLSDVIGSEAQFDGALEETERVVFETGF